MLAAINVDWGLMNFGLKLLGGVIIFIFVLIIIGVLKDKAREAERQEDIKKHRKTDPFYGMSDDEVWRLADKGNKNAMYEYYLLHMWDDTIRAYGWLVGAAKAGHPRACWIVAEDYLNGYFYNNSGKCMLYFDEHPTYFGGKPSRETLRSWLECAANGGMEVEQSLWNKLNRYNR